VLGGLYIMIHIERLLLRFCCPLKENTSLFFIPDKPQV
jgi:hypothetical protein